MRKSRERDRLHLLHMRDAAQAAHDFCAGRDRAELDNNPLLQMALAKAIELTGESANHLSGELRALQPHIPWANIIGMRHVLVHNYWYVEMDEVWNTAQHDMPTLIAQLQQLIDQEETRGKR